MDKTKLIIIRKSSTQGGPRQLTNLEWSFKTDRQVPSQYD